MTACGGVLVSEHSACRRRGGLVQGCVSWLIGLKKYGMLAAVGVSRHAAGVMVSAGIRPVKLVYGRNMRNIGRVVMTLDGVAFRNGANMRFGALWR